MGKSEDVIQNALHNKKISDQTMRRIYKHFLSEQEINEVITGKELYLDSDEIVERLEAREEYFENNNKFPDDPLPEQVDFNQEDFFEEVTETVSPLPTKKVPAKKVSKKKE
jgi:ribosomal protein L16 Arg81 hydroxylase